MLNFAIAEENTDTGTPYPHARPDPSFDLPPALYGTLEPVVSIYDPDVLRLAIDESKERLFNYLASEWLADTVWQSSISIITGHRNFERIKELGPIALELTLKRIQVGDIQIHWFPILHDLSGGQNPVPYDSHGIVKEMADAWLNWGVRQSII